MRPTRSQMKAALRPPTSSGGIVVFWERVEEGFDVWRSDLIDKSKKARLTHADAYRVREIGSVCKLLHIPFIERER
jgi:hypothetical protein